MGLARTASAGFSAMSMRSGAIDELEAAGVQPFRAEQHDVDAVGSGLGRACNHFAGSPVPAERVDSDPRAQAATEREA